MLKESEGEHRHERMTVEALPRSALEVVETEFLFQLLMCLFTNPSRLHGCGQGAQAGRGRQIGKVVPGFVARQMLLTLVPDSLWWSIGCADADSSKACLELAFRPSSPAHSLPLGIGQHVCGR